jgi:hypothetical protein
MSNPFRDKLLTIGVLGHGRTRDRVVDVRADGGQVVGKSTTDELRNTVTTYADRQDVTIRPPHLRFELGATVKEER